MNRDQRQSRPGTSGRTGQGKRPPRRSEPAGSTSARNKQSRGERNSAPLTPEELETIRLQREERMYTRQQSRQQKVREEKRKEQQAKRRKQRTKTARWEKRRQENQRAPAKPLVRRKLVIKLVTALAVVLALVLGMTIFFKVQNIQVTGNSKYTAGEIIAASGIEIGENLLTFGEYGASGNILAKLPYVGDVQIGIKLPDTVNIDIVELSASYAIEDESGAWWLMDSTGTLLEQTDESATVGHIRIVGIKAHNPTVGQAFAVAAAAESGDETEGEDETGSEEDPTGSATDRADAAREIMRALSAADRSGEITVLDVSELYNMQIFYGDAYQVLLSGPADLSYKIRYMVEAVESLTEQGYRGGVLDLSFRTDGKAIFTPW